MSIHFHVGQKVVCVPAERAAWRKNLKSVSPEENLPKKGNIYTIRAVMAFGETMWLHLEEVANRPRLYAFPDGVSRLMECPFEARYFRPVVERKTDISIFTAMLNPTKKTVEV